METHNVKNRLQNYRNNNSVFKQNIECPVSQIEDIMLGNWQIVN